MVLPQILKILFSQPCVTEVFTVNTVVVFSKKSP